MSAPHRIAMCLAMAGAGAALAGDKAVQESNDYYRRPLEQLLQVETQAKAAVGSRGGARDALDAEVPIDIITSAQLQSTGQPDLQRALAVLVPGFNAPRPSITDGTDHACGDGQETATPHVDRLRAATLAVIRLAHDFCCHPALRKT